MSRRWLMAWAAGLAAAICLPAWAKPSGPLPPGRSAFGRLRAGAAKVAITPTSPVWMGGWGENRMMEGVHDDIWARALYLSDGRTEITLVSVDLVGLMGPDHAPIKAAVTGVVGPNVFISSTHTHSGPDTMGLWGPDEMTPGWDAAYIAYVQQRTIEAILQAKGSAQPAWLSCGSVLTTVEDHIATNEGLPEDHEVSVLRVVGRDPAKSTIATVFNFACHPEVCGGNHEDMSVWKYISSDIGNYAYLQIEAAAGGTAIWLQGALGGVTVDDWEGRNWVVCERIGRTLGNRVLEAGASADPEGNPVLACETEVLNVPLYNEALYAAMVYGILHYSADNLVANDQSPLGVGVQTVVSTLRIGTLEIATTPGEPYPQIGLNIKQSILTSPHKMVLGLSQDELGYMVYPEDFGQWPYEYLSSMSVGPTIGVDVEAGLARAKARLP
jgi:hypothetical protein